MQKEKKKTITIRIPTNNLLEREEKIWESIEQYVIKYHKEMHASLVITRLYSHNKESLKEKLLIPIPRQESVTFNILNDLKRSGAPY
jgi:DNA/RNA endonuclease G (NUC1)